MDRRKIPAGTKQNLETVFDNVQSDAAENLKRRILTVFDTFGPVVSVKAGVVEAGETALQLTTGANLLVNIDSGQALLENGEMIRLAASDSYDASSVSADIYYVI